MCVRLGVEDDLLAKLTLVVDVDERLMERIVGKQVGVDRQRTEVHILDAIAKAHRLLFSHELDALPLERQASIALEKESRRENLFDAFLLCLRETGLHDFFGRNAELVRNIDHVHDERAFDATVLEHDVEVAERRGVRPGGAHAAEYDCQPEQNLAEHSGHSTV